MRQHNLQPVPGYEDLAHCPACQCAEGTLPDHCPGVPVPYQVQKLILNGVVNFVNGRWVGENSPRRRMARSARKLGVSIGRMAAAMRGAADSLAAYRGMQATGRLAPGEVAPEMVREMEAHMPFQLRDGDPVRRWDWAARYLTEALRHPAARCPCCGVTPEGDIQDHLPTPREEFIADVQAARAAWRICARTQETPFDKFVEEGM